MENKVFGCVSDLLKVIQETQQENIETAARLFADALEKGGMLQAFLSQSDHQISALHAPVRHFLVLFIIASPSGKAMDKYVFQIIHVIILCLQFTMRKMIR